MRQLVGSFAQGVHKRTLFTLCAIDLFFVVATGLSGALAVIGLLETIPPLVNVGRDWSIPETLNYLKWFTLSLIFLFAFMRGRHTLLLFLAVFFFLLMLDDSLQLHEQFGDMVSGSLYGHEGYKAYVQALYWVLIGIGFIFIAMKAYRAAPTSVQQRVVPMIVPFVGLMFFGVFVDFLHSTISEEGTLLAGLLILLEDGGELLMISCLLAYAVKQWTSLEKSQDFSA